MSETNQLVYIKVKDGKKNYVESINLFPNNEVEMEFTDKKNKAKSFEPKDADIIKKVLHKNFNHGYIEPDDRIAANA